jgi:hypothetical protein
MAEIGDFDPSSKEEGVKAHVKYLEEIANEILQFDSSMSDLEKRELILSVTGLNPAFEAIAGLIKLLPLSPEQFDGAFVQLGLLISNAFTIGVSSMFGDESKKYIAELRAAKMRDAKAKTREIEETALGEAIEAERGNGSVAQPTKEANAILSAVNERMKVAGLESVSVDKIRRRLEKLPRS